MLRNEMNLNNNYMARDYKAFSDNLVLSVIEKSETAFADWKHLNFEKRASCFFRLAELLTLHQDELAALITFEMGKVYQESVAEIQKCIFVCEYYAEHAEELLKDQQISSESHNAYVTYQPLGVVLAVMPWNYPFWQVLRCAAPIMMAGNTFLLRHANNVSGCAMRIEELFEDAGFPSSCMQTLIVSHDQVHDVIKHPAIQGVTLTGSTYAGSKVAATAAACIKKTVLELGGSDPYLVLDDADLNLAVNACATSRLLNAGQSCIAAKRFIVMDAVYDAFLDKLAARFDTVKMGDPFAPDTTLGPMSSVKSRDDLHEQVRQSVSSGAKCLAGGKIPDMEGAYYPPTILADVKPGMPAYDEELFGPVASVIRAKSEEEAVQMANDNPYGLGSGIFSRDIERANRIARTGIQSGMCAVNGFVASDPRLPFGGVKQSGYGRELSAEGIREFTNMKTVIITI